jgi:BirA family transcriptional regulator, biotin operon repressor / biotin---[acetyl-CoA-carboxylase] ligase
VREFEEALERTRDRRGGFGDPFHFHFEIGSTNDEAARLAEAGARHGTTVVAAAQTAGRGRLGRTWFSPPDAGLYVSVVIREPRAAALLTLAGGVAVAAGIRNAVALPAEIKWPNDIVVESGLGKRRKLAGILTEASTGAEGLQFVVIGFGINLLPTSYPADLADRATSVQAELGRPVERTTLLVECLAALSGRVRDVASGNHRVVLERWLELSPSAFNARVEAEGVSGPVTGTTAGLAADGALLVKTRTGIEAIRSGVVRWL